MEILLHSPFNSYDGRRMRYNKLLKIKTVEILKIMVKASAVYLRTPLVPAKISSRFFNRHWKEKKEETC